MREVLVRPGHGGVAGATGGPARPARPAPRHAGPTARHVRPTARQARPTARHGRPTARQARAAARHTAAAGRSLPAAGPAQDLGWRRAGQARVLGWRPARLAGRTGWRTVAAPARRAIIALTVRLLLAVPIAAIPLVVIPLMVTTPADSVAPPPGWTAVFSDSFTAAAGSGADPAWIYDTGTHYRGAGCGGNWNTGEIEMDTNSAANVSQDGSGHLDITPLAAHGAWTSGRIETVAANFAAPAGGEMAVSASIRQPSPAHGLGYWASFSLLGAGDRASGAGTSGTMNCSNGPATGEIDVMEDVNALSRVSGTLHCGTPQGGPCHEGIGLTSGLRPCPGCQTGYNTYSVIIDRVDPGNESITWYLNGHAYHQVTEGQVGTAAWRAAVDHGFFLLLGVAIGGGYPGSVCHCLAPSPQTASGAAMSVGYVTVYTHDREPGGAEPPAANGTMIMKPLPRARSPPPRSLRKH